MMHLFRRLLGRAQADTTAAWRSACATVQSARSRRDCRAQHHAVLRAREAAHADLRAFVAGRGK